MEAAAWRCEAHVRAEKRELSGDVLSVSSSLQAITKSFSSCALCHSPCISEPYGCTLLHRCKSRLISWTFATSRTSSTFIYPACRGEGIGVCASPPDSCRKSLHGQSVRQMQGFQPAQRYGKTQTVETGLAPPVSRRPVPFFTSSFRRGCHTTATSDNTRHSMQDRSIGSSQSLHEVFEAVACRVNIR